MTSKQAKWNWSQECQKIFDTFKISSRETLFSRPNFNKPVVIRKYTNKVQLEAVIRVIKLLPSIVKSEIQLKLIIQPLSSNYCP